MLAAGAVLLTASAAEAAEWTEVLVTIGDVNAVAMADGREVMTYYASGGVALIAGDTMRRAAASNARA